MNLKGVLTDTEAQVPKEHCQRNYRSTDIYARMHTHMKSTMRMGPLMTAIIRTQNCLRQVLFATTDPPKITKEYTLHTRSLLFFCCLCKSLCCYTVYCIHSMTLHSFSIFITHLHTFMKLWIQMLLLHGKSIRKNMESLLEEKVCSAYIQQHPCSTPLSGSLNPTVSPGDHGLLWGTVANWGE
jgi:hypothetical protein